MREGFVLSEIERIASATASTPLTGAARFEQWVDLYQPRVARLAQRLLGWRADGAGDVDDVVQDVFMAALHHAEGFRGEASPWTWLAAITINRCRAQMRRTILVRKLGLSGWFGPRAGAPAADVAMLDNEVHQRVRDSVFALPAKEREVVVLYYLEEFSAAEIGRMLGITVNAVDVRLHRARAKLKCDLAGWEKE